MAVVLQSSSFICFIFLIALFYIFSALIFAWLLRFPPLRHKKKTPACGAIRRCLD